MSAEKKSHNPAGGGRGTTDKLGGGTGVQAEFVDDGYLGFYHGFIAVPCV